MKNLTILSLLVSASVSLLVSPSIETEICLKDLIQPETVNDKQKNSTLEEALADSISKTEDNDQVKQKIENAATLYKQAVISYEQGKKELSKQLYSKAFKILYSVDPNPDIFFKLKDEFDNLFVGLCRTDFKAKEKNSLYSKYTIPMNTDNELVQKFIRIYSDKKMGAEIKEGFLRSGTYRKMIVKILKEYNLPEELVYLPIVESRYYNNNLSKAGALGIWQLMPHRARALGLKVNYWIDERKDPEKATHAACKYLRDLYLIFNDWHLALAAYNRGEYGLIKDMEYSKAIELDQISKRQATPKETELFVPQFIACTLVCDSYKEWELNLAKPIRYDKVIINKVVDLEVVARCAGTNISTIRKLNPAIKAWCTPHNYPNFMLHLPKGTKNKFFANLALVKDLNPMPGHLKYKVVTGDCLGSIAKKLFTTVTAILRDNKIKNPNKLKNGQVLLVRPGKEYFTAENN